jgi:hypothetical protein
MAVAMALAMAAPAGATRPGEAELFAALEGGALPVVGRIDDVRPLDSQGYGARVWVERVLGAASDAYEEGTPIAFAWEERARGRAPRFEPGGRALLVLEPLPSASIWRTRIPDALQRHRTRAVAGKGSAYLLDPGIATLDLLHHYLSLPVDARGGATGVGYLTALTEKAQLALAVGAAMRLAKLSSLADALTPGSAVSLVRALAREDASDALAAPLLEAVGHARGSLLEDALRTATRRQEASAPPALLFQALAVTASASLSEEDVQWLSARPDPAYRRVVATTATSRDATRLRQLARSDPDETVRGAAVERFVVVRLESEAPEARAQALALALGALADPSDRVRAVAARSAARCGDEAVEPLRAIVQGSYPHCCQGSPAAARSAIVALSLAGIRGRVALAEIASDHPDPALQRLARVALGEFETHAH